MMKSDFTVKLCIVIAALGCIATACSKMDATYKDFLTGGEFRYSARVDSIQVFPGHNRIRLSWLLRSDPNIVESRVFWNNGADSIEVPVKRTTGVDTISTIIDDLEEGSYTFVIYTYDKEGNASIGTDTIGRVYGESYIGSLSDRLMKNAVLVNGTPRIAWYDEPDKQAIATEIRYTDQMGMIHEIAVPLSESVTRIGEHPLGDSIQYRTLFLPDAMAIDTFYTVYKTLLLEEAEPVALDKSKFKELKLPTDAPLSKYSSGMAALWDGKLDSKHFYGTNAGWMSPHWFTFDMGVTANLSHYIMWQRGEDNHALLYANANPQLWEVWGSNDPAPDGSWDGWVKLMDCESVKPSGLPLGETTQEDIDKAIAGETFTFPSGTPPVRYIRIKILQTWDKKDNDHSFMAELTLYGIAE